MSNVDMVSVPFFHLSVSLSVCFCLPLCLSVSVCSPPSISPPLPLFLSLIQGMRIDYFLVSKSLAPRIKEVKVFGKGADREGFLGSDHSPLMLTLLPSP